MKLGIVGMLPGDFRTFTKSQMQAIRDLKFTGFGFHLNGDDVFNITAQDCKTYRQFMAEEALDLAQFAITYNECLFHPGKAERDGAMVKINRGTEIATQLGAQAFLIRPGGLNPAGPWTPHRDNHLPENTYRLIETLKPIARKAELEGVILVMETHVVSIMDPPDKCRQIVESVGLEVKDGVVEIYPDVNRARRLPFGDQIVFSGGGYRKRPTDDPIPWASQKLWEFEVLKEHWCVNPYKVLRDLKGHRTYSKNVYTPKRYSSNNHNRTDDRLGLNTDDRGKAKRDKSTDELSSNSQEIERILNAGLREESTRYETEKRLIRWCYATGKSEGEAYELIEDWYNSGKTNGFSKDWIRSAGKVLSALKRHVISFYRWLKERWTGSKAMEREPLTTEDVRKIIEVCDWDIGCAEWLYDCLKWAKARRQSQKHLYLSAKIMRKFKRGRNANKKWVPFLVEKGILTCVDGDFFVGNRCRTWQVNWKFSQIGKIVPDSLSFKEALVLVTTVDEIKGHYPKVTAWRLNRLRKELEGLVLEEVNGKESPEPGFEVALEMRIESSPQRKVDNLDGVQLVFEWYPRRE